jgi:hypothetical protein
VLGELIAGVAATVKENSPARGMRDPGVRQRGSLASRDREGTRS